MIDFNNDALDLIVDALRPLIGEGVTIDGCFRHGGDYLAGTLVDVDCINGPHVVVHKDYSHEVVRLHASEECHRIRVCR